MKSFHSPVQVLGVNANINGQTLQIVRELKYLGFTWTNKMPLKTTINKTLENIQRTFSESRWITGGKVLSNDVLRKGFWADSFLHFARISILYPFLSSTQKQSIFPIAWASDLLQIINVECSKDYLKQYINRRPVRMEKAGIGRSLFYIDAFYWDLFDGIKK